MKYTFTLVLDGPNPLADENLDRLYEAGCDDATFGERDGVFIADFDREAASFSDALLSAIRDIEYAVPGLRVVRVEPEDLVTASEIAARTGRSRESVRLLFEGRRGAGEFPRPVAWLADRTRLWRWSEVCQWFNDCGQQSCDPRWSQDASDWITITNSVLRLRTCQRVATFFQVDAPEKFHAWVQDLFKDEPLADVLTGALMNADKASHRT
jgi:predicted DNA-binding transcriptional regulator AlpA